MNFGLSDVTIAKINAVFAGLPAIEKAVLYGTRAKGNFQPGSDIDLTMYGATLTQRELNSIANALDELVLPYSIDLSIFAELKHPEA